jgi:hypothetical protein
MFTLLTPHAWYLLLYILAKKKWTVCWEDIKKGTEHFDQVCTMLVVQPCRVK